MINKTILIASTNTNVGKTTATVSLISEFAKLGIKAVGFKPIETGVLTLPLDGLALFGACKIDGISLDDICPVRYKLPSAPYIQNKPIDWQKIMSAFEKISKLVDIVLIESAGGLMSPIEKDLFNIDLYKKFNCSNLLLVCNSSLGCLSDVVVYSQKLDSSAIKNVICVNRRENDDFEKISLPFWIDYFGECLELQRDAAKIANELYSTN